ncbi:MAG: hypothetical protein AB7V13_16300 [Pseudorhodoplanes sp.]|uniref:hypothetical protein n=1 Tax=Pseudorhodoplanes sp. TaxID=1934341 RepID=UPI003D12CE89
MQTTFNPAADKPAARRGVLLGRAATAIAAASILSFGCGGAVAQEASGSVGVRFAPAAAGQLSAIPAPAAAPAAAKPAEQARTARAPQTPAPATTGSTLPAINVTGEKPKQKPARQVTTQGPKREPIKMPVTSVGCNGVRAPGKPYFVEFRSRTAVSYGHTFVLHGRLGGGNRFAGYQIAGLHPKGDDPNVYLQGMMVPVESETGPSWGDQDEQYLTARFCVTLTEAEYRKALAYIKHLQATKKTWHATTYNCNAFAADIARHIGLDSPNPNMYLPETFIKRMADLNPRGKPANSFSWGFGGFQQAPAAQSQQRRAPAQRTAQPASRSAVQRQ